MNTRADPFDLDLADFAPKPAKPKVSKQEIRAVSEANQFPSRTATKPIEPQAPRRRRTGRNVQLNIKVTQATLERFTKLADSNGWAFGEALERAVEALEEQRLSKI